MAAVWVFFYDVPSGLLADVNHRKNRPGPSPPRSASAVYSPPGHPPSAATSTSIIPHALNSINTRSRPANQNASQARITEHARSISQPLRSLWYLKQSIINPSVIVIQSAVLNNKFFGFFCRPGQTSSFIYITSCIAPFILSTSDCDLCVSSSIAIYVWVVRCLSVIS